MAYPSLLGFCVCATVADPPGGPEGDGARFSRQRLFSFYAGPMVCTYSLVRIQGEKPSAPLRDRAPVQPTSAPKQHFPRATIPEWLARTVWLRATEAAKFAVCFQPQPLWLLGFDGFIARALGLRSRRALSRRSSLDFAAPILTARYFQQGRVHSQVT